MHSIILHRSIRLLGFILLSFSFSSQIFAKETLKIGYLPILDHLPLLVSHSLDNKNFQHINIEPKLFTSWREMVGALDAGVIQGAFILSPLAMNLFHKGADIRTILLAHRDGSAITVKSDSDIHSAADLRGKRIAVPSADATHTALLNKYLEQAGMSLQDVVTKVIAPAHMPLAMQHGRIDAFIVAEPFGAKAQHDGLGKILVLTKQIVDNHVECIVIVKTPVLQANPQGVQEWVNSLIKAGRFIDADKLHNNSQKVAELTAKKYFPHSIETIVLGLQNPSDRISFSDLNPRQEDFAKIMEIAVQAKIVERISLADFIEAKFFINSSQPAE